MILEKILRALASLILIWYWSSIYNSNIYSDLIFDSFIASIASVLCLLNFRSFSFLGYKPLKKNLKHVFLFLIFISLLLFIQDNKWWFITLLIPFAQYSYYIEKTSPKLFYLVNIIFILISIPITLYEISFFIVVLLPNFFIGFYFYFKDTFLLKKHINFNHFKSKNLITYAIPLFINTLLIVLYTKIDVFLVDFLSGDEKFKSQYFTSVKIVDYLIMLPVTYISYSLRYWISKSSFPKIYDFRFILICSLFLIIPGLIAVPFLSDYVPLSKFTFYCYLFLIPVIAINTIRNNILIINEQNWNISIYSFISIFLNLFLSYSLFNYFGIWSVLYGTMITQIVLIIPSIFASNSLNLFEPL